MLDTRVLAANIVGDVEGDGRLKRVKPKTWKSQSQKSSISKKLSKNRNLPKSNNKNNESSFSIPEARVVFNCLRLAFTKAPIFWHFDLKCHIWIKTNALGYAISEMLS